VERQHLPTETSFREAETSKTTANRQKRVSLVQRCLAGARAWWDLNRRLAQLGSASEEEWKRAAAYFAARPEYMPALWRCVEHGAVGQACGAAVALTRQGKHGVQVALMRCYDEEWLIRSLRDGHIEGLRALRRLGRETIGEVLQAALRAAGRETDPVACVRHLTLVLSALRLLIIFDGESPLEWWEWSLKCGRSSLHGLRAVPTAVPAFTLTERIRRVALRGLITEHPSAAYDVFMAALRGSAHDHSVARAALWGLQRLRDRRALPELEALAFTPGHPLATEARRTIECIAGTQADSLILLRSAEPDYATEELLRPVDTTPRQKEAEKILVRPIRAVTLGDQSGSH
jgi:hypothetical protein